jgi:hypothetical protein
MVREGFWPCPLLLLPCRAGAHVVRLAVEHRTVSAGYERLAGRFFGELDPSDPLNAIINDLFLASKNARGRVKYAATFTLIRPIDPAKRDCDA